MPYNSRKTSPYTPMAPQLLLRHWTVYMFARLRLQTIENKTHLYERLLHHHGCAYDSQRSAASVQVLFSKLLTSSITLFALFNTCSHQISETSAIRVRARGVLLKFRGSRTCHFVPPQEVSMSQRQFIEREEHSIQRVR